MIRIFLRVAIGVLLLLAISCKKEKDVVTLEVMSFNVRMDSAADSLNNWKYRKDNIAQMIAYYSPDVIGTQEVLKNQLDDLKERLPGYAVIGVGREDGKEKGEYSAIFYDTHRFSSLDEGTFALSETPERIGSMGWDAACERIVTWAFLKDKSSGREIALFNTHFDHVGKVARVESAKLILSRIEEISQGRTVVLTGDFNVTLSSEAVKTLIDGGLVNSAVDAPIIYGPRWSFHDFGRVPLERRSLIDFIFTSKDISLKSFRVIDDNMEGGYLSDHTPIFVSMEL